MRNCETQDGSTHSHFHARSWVVLVLLMGYSLFVLCSFGFGSKAVLEDSANAVDGVSENLCSFEHDTFWQDGNWNQIEIQKTLQDEFAIFTNDESVSDFYVVITSTGNPLDKHQISLESIPADKGKVSRNHSMIQRPLLARKEINNSRIKTVRFEQHTTKVVKETPESNCFQIPVFYDSHSLPSTTTTVNAKVAARGDWLTVYLDESEIEMCAANRLAREVVHQMESIVAPHIKEILSLAGDRYPQTSILLTTRFAPNQTFNDRDDYVPIRGFVNPFGSTSESDIEVICLDSRLQINSDLQALLFHEYTHVITNRVDRLNSFSRDDWMKEAIAHSVEILSYSSLENINPRIEAFLANPHSKPLIIQDFRESGLYRDPVSRGAGALFLNYCVEQYGEKILNELLYANEKSAEAFEASTQTKFSQLLQQWGLALADANLSNETAQSIRFINAHEKVMNEQMSGTSNLFIRCSHIEPGTAIRISATPGTKIQVAVKMIPQS